MVGRSEGDVVVGPAAMELGRAVIGANGAFVLGPNRRSKKKKVYN